MLSQCLKPVNRNVSFTKVTAQLGCGETKRGCIYSIFAITHLTVKEFSSIVLYFHTTSIISNGHTWFPIRHTSHSKKMILSQPCSWGWSCGTSPTRAPPPSLLFIFISLNPGELEPHCAVRTGAQLSMTHGCSSECWVPLSASECGEIAADVIYCWR